MGVCACTCMWAWAYLCAPACVGLCVMAYALVCLFTCVWICECADKHMCGLACACVCVHICTLGVCSSAYLCTGVYGPRVSVDVCARAHRRVFVCVMHVLVSCTHVCISALCLRVHIYTRGACSFVYTCARVHACVCTRVHACVSACVCWKQGVLSPFLSCPSPPLLLQLVPLLFRTLLRDQVPRREPP